MKKKKYLKKWVQDSLVMVNLFTGLVFCADHPSDKVFMIKNIICLGVMILNMIILKKRGRFE